MGKYVTSYSIWKSGWFRIEEIKNIPFQKGDVHKTHASTYKIKKFINYNSKTSIKEGVGKFIDWYIEYNK